MIFPLFISGFPFYHFPSVLHESRSEMRHSYSNRCLFIFKQQLFTEFPSVLTPHWQHESQTLRESVFLASRTLAPPSPQNCQFFTFGDFVQIYLITHDSSSDPDVQRQEQQIGMLSCFSLESTKVIWLMTSALNPSCTEKLCSQLLMLFWSFGLCRCLTFSFSPA